MNTIDYIKTSLITARKMTLELINDLKDEPLAQPTINGGNHALWILGHIAHTDSSLLNQMIQGQETCTLEHLKEHFAYSTQPSTDASIYPSFDSLLKDYDTAHAEVIAYLDTITEDDLDKPSVGCPEDWKDFIGTVGKCLNVISLHTTMHYGQLADIRKSLGRAPIMG
ncbi:MAG: DinB family protein [Phycisphaerales bacterium]|nr:DinB family protein [Phycisphaerales bacterium]